MSSRLTLSDSTIYDRLSIKGRAVRLSSERGRARTQGARLKISGSRRIDPATQRQRADVTTRPAAHHAAIAPTIRTPPVRADRRPFGAAKRREF